MAEKKKTRDSGIELLRIISIMMVIGLHAFSYGNYYDVASEMGGFVNYCSVGIRILFRPAVNIFILITGYFMVRMKFDLNKAYKKVLNVYLTVIFYSITLTLLILLLGPEYYTINGQKDSIKLILLSMIMPVTSQRWYFLTHYLFLCLLAPFFNIILQNIKKKDYHILLAIVTFLLCIWYVLSDIRLLDQVVRVNGFSDLQSGGNVFFFLYIYMIGGYIRLHVSKNEKPRSKYILGFICCAGLNCLLATVLKNTLELDDIVLKYTNPLVILMAVCLLMYFKDLHFHNKIVNTISATTLGVYAIHEFNYIRNIIWKIFNFRKVDCSNMFLNVVYIISIIIIVFGICASLDLLRQKLFKLVGKKDKNLRNLTEI